MAAGTPTIWTPASTVPIDWRLELVKSPYVGGGTQSAVEWDGNGTTTGWVAADGRWATADTIAVWLERYGVAVGATIAFKVRVKNSLAEVSAWSATVTITVGAGRITAARWLQGLA